jgi:FAD-dependent urate hydroxylase
MDNNQQVEMSQTPFPVPSAAAARLDDLRRAIEHELALLSYKPREWLAARDETLEVLIVGGGHAGQAIAFALARRDVGGVLVIDASPAGREGPWSTTARMRTLRTPKTLKGPDLDVPSLSPHSWYVARYGQDAWDEIRHIPRLDWQDYLRFYRDVTGIRVENSTRAISVGRPESHDAPFSVEVERDGVRRVLRANRVIFATGLEGAGGANVPDSLFGRLPADAWAHTSDDIDFARLRGKRVGVLGGGASAFDAAGTALEFGAESVDSFMRRKAMPVSNPLRWMEWGTFLEHFPDWDDDRKWAFARRMLEIDQPTTQNSLWRCFEHDNFALSFGAPWHSTRWEDGEVVVDVAGTEHRFDFVIAGTGITVDLTLRPELAGVVDEIGLWRDHHAPAADEHDGLAAYPYLDAHFAFTPKPGHDAPWLSRLYHFAQGSRVTMGITGHMLSGLPAGVQRLVWGVTRDLFREHADEIYSDFYEYSEPELVNIGKQPEGTPAMQLHASTAAVESTDVAAGR